MSTDIEFLLLFASFFSLAGFVFGVGIRQHLTSTRLARAYEEGKLRGVAEAAIYMQPAVNHRALQRVK
jgi:hypothetical protein